MSPEEDRILKETLDDLLKKGCIEPANSPFACDVRFLYQAKGKLLLCVDYRPQNAISVVDQNRLHRIDELIDQVHRARYFAKLDLHRGFHQIRVQPEHIPSTAFCTKYVLYQYRVMPFGLCNAPATFQRTMCMLTSDYRDFAGMYIDVLLVFLIP